MNDRERKYQTANSGEITTNLYEDLDSKVETINYEEGAQKIRELQQKIAFMEKYIKELETSVHLQRTQSATKMALLSPSFCATYCLLFCH